MPRIGLRTRLILLGLLAVLAVGVVATASAEPPPPSGSCTAPGIPAYCVAGAPLVSSSEKTESTSSGGAVLKATVAGVTSEIKCKKGKSKGTIEGGTAGTVGKSTVTMVFEECEMIAPTNCKLNTLDEGEIETAPLKGELVMTAGRVEDKLESKTPIFATIEAEGKTSSCAMAPLGKVKSYEVTGSQLCEVDANNTEAETEAATHKIKCTNPVGLKVGGNKAEMTTEATIKLTSGKNWSVKET
jgi:hypothetical protein